jgi:RND family efflux transporter MFP subunit
MAHLFRLPIRIFKFFLRHKKLTFLIVPLILITIFYLNSQAKTKPLETTKVQRQDIKSTITASGILSGKNTVDLRFKSGGKLAYLNVKAGDSVEKGQDLAGLDTQDLNIALQQARNTLKDKQATLEKVIDDIHLFQYGNGGFDNVGTANETQTQKALRTTAEQAANNADEQVRAAQKAFQDAQITAPIAGVITKADPVPGQTVGLTDLIAEIVDDSETKFNADVDEGDIGQVSVGQPVEFTLNAYPDKTFQGTVEQILPTTKTTTTGATVVTVKVGFNSAAINFVAGLNGDANIIISQAKNALTIPSEALKEDNTVVVQKADKSYEVRKVEPGISSDTDVEIRSGLSDGETVVKNPPAKLPSNGNPLLGMFRR